MTSVSLLAPWRTRESEPRSAPELPTSPHTLQQRPSQMLPSVLSEPLPARARLQMRRPARRPATTDPEPMPLPSLASSTESLSPKLTPASPRSFLDEATRCDFRFSRVNFDSRARVRVSSEQGTVATRSVEDVKLRMFSVTATSSIEDSPVPTLSSVQSPRLEPVESAEHDLQRHPPQNQEVPLLSRVQPLP